VPAPGCNARLIRFFDFGAIYIVCLFILYSSPVILFSSIFPYFSLIYLFLWEWIDSLRFQAGCRKRWLNLALVFLCLFSVVALLPYAFSAMPSVLCLQCYAFSAMPSVLCLQCYAFSAMPSVLWRCFGSRKGIQPVKTEWWDAGVVICLGEMQTCIWPSWCHCHSLSLASVKSRLFLPFWYRLTWVVPENWPLNGYVCFCCSTLLLVGDCMLLLCWV